MQAHGPLARAVPVRAAPPRALQRVLSRVPRLPAEDADRVPPPENVRITGRRQVYVLQWNHTGENVTFEAQWL